jgi:hypothetical protein
MMLAHPDKPSDEDREYITLLSQNRKTFLSDIFVFDIKNLVICDHFQIHNRRFSILNQYMLHKQLDKTAPWYPALEKLNKKYRKEDAASELLHEFDIELVPETGKYYCSFILYDRLHAVDVDTAFEQDLDEESGTVVGEPRSIPREKCPRRTRERTYARRKKWYKERKDRIDDADRKKEEKKKAIEDEAREQRRKKEEQAEIEAIEKEAREDRIKGEKFADDHSKIEELEAKLKSKLENIDGRLDNDELGDKKEDRLESKSENIEAKLESIAAGDLSGIKVKPSGPKGDGSKPKGDGSKPKPVDNKSSRGGSSSGRGGKK